jgi:hypothetical protein
MQALNINALKFSGIVFPYLKRDLISSQEISGKNHTCETAIVLWRSRHIGIGPNWRKERKRFRMNIITGKDGTKRPPISFLSNQGP